AARQRRFEFPSGVYSNGPVARDDSASTDEDHGTNVSVLANDRNTPRSHSNAGLQVVSIDTTGTKGNVTLNGDGTIAYDPNGQFEGLKVGQSATDTFSYQAKKGRRSSAPALVTVTVAGVNDPPIVTTTAGSTPYTESDPATVIDNGLTAADPDSTQFESARVAITDGFNAGDTLDFTNPGPGGIMGFYDSNAGVLSLTGTASQADWQAA